jgi:hypothetical protein
LLEELGEGGVLVTPGPRQEDSGQNGAFPGTGGKEQEGDGEKGTEQCYRGRTPVFGTLHMIYP